MQSTGEERDSSNAAAKNRTRRWRRRAPWLLVALAVGGLLAWALWPSSLIVEVARAEVGPLQVTVDEDGWTRAHDRYVVAAPVAGRVARIELRDGDPVSRGQVLARLYPLPLGAQEREQANARLASAQALEREAAERAAHARADAEQAKRERERVERLVKNGFVSPQAAEQARLTERTSSNEYEAARFRSQSAAAEVRAAQATLLALQASERGAPTAIPVTSPVDGRVLRIVDPSERVVAAGTSLLTLGDATQLEVVLDVLSSEAVKVKTGMPVMLEGWGGERPLRAKVRLVEPYAFTKVSALGVEEQRVNVIADFVDSPQPLGDGYRVDARIVVWSEERALKVPASALFRDGGQWSVFVVERARARARRVEVGRRNGLEAQVMAGLRQGEIVIRHPNNELRAGMRVAPAASAGS